MLLTKFRRSEHPLVQFARLDAGGLSLRLHHFSLLNNQRVNVEPGVQLIVLCLLGRVSLVKLCHRAALLGFYLLFEQDRLFYPRI